jgi:DNA-binding CsgD family transcriptional regulator
MLGFSLVQLLVRLGLLRIMLKLQAYLGLFELFESAESNRNYGSMIRDACRLLRVDEALHLVMNLPTTHSVEFKSAEEEVFSHILWSAVGTYKCVTPQTVKLDFNSQQTKDEFSRHFFGKYDFDFEKTSHQNLVTDLISIEGEFGETSVMVVAARRSEAQWKILKQRRHLEIHSIGEFFHHHLISNTLTRETDFIPDLTAREVEVLRFSAHGNTYIEIAKALQISSRTVRFFLENARQKLGSRNTTHAVAFALQHGII